MATEAEKQRNADLMPEIAAVIRDIRKNGGGIVAITVKDYDGNVLLQHGEHFSDDRMVEIPGERAALMMSYLPPSEQRVSRSGVVRSARR